MDPFVTVVKCCHGFSHQSFSIDLSMQNTVGCLGTFIHSCYYKISIVIEHGRSGCVLGMILSEVSRLNQLSRDF